MRGRCGRACWGSQILSLQLSEHEPGPPANLCPLLHVSSSPQCAVFPSDFPSIVSFHHTRTHTHHRHTYSHACTHRHIYTPMNMHTCIHTQIHTDIHKHIHAHTRTHTHSPDAMLLYSTMRSQFYSFSGPFISWMDVSAQGKQH